jgi:urea transport system ATP-binding protein
MSATLAAPLEVDTGHGVVLYLEDVTVSFDGFKALNGLTLYVNVGELRCVIGPNGAGKTTMMDVVTGRTRPDRGRAFFGQSLDLTRLSEAEIARAGIGRKFQKPTVFQDHTVLENLELAGARDRSARARLFAVPGAEDRRRIEETLEIVRLEGEAHRPAGLLSHGQKQWLEIGMLLMQDPKLLLLDEPVAGLTDEETERSADLVRGLAGKRSVVVVEHDMDFVERLGGTVTVLHEGSVLAEGPLERVQKDPKVVEVYLGR